MQKIISLREEMTGILYRKFLRKVLFKFDSEKVHKGFISFGKKIGEIEIAKSFFNKIYGYEDEILRQKILGIEFENPIGLSAGFDKNAEIIEICESIGFGFSEIGSVTAKKCLGNSGKRLNRLIEKESLWVHLGLNNEGADEISSRLQGKKFSMPIGISVAKTNCKETANDEIGIRDYVYSLDRFSKLNVGDYYVLNISCPNAYGGEPFSRPKAYKALLKEVEKLNIKKPIFVKISPDLMKKNVDEILKISKKYRISGFIISNLTKKHRIGKGGLSGKAVEKDANKMLSYIYKKNRGKYVLIGVGGVFSAEDAYKKIRLGASLVELITGMIYNGPGAIGEINKGLAFLLKRDGFSSVSEAIGAEFRKT